MTVTRRSVLIAGTATPVVLAGTSEVQAARSPPRRRRTERRAVPLRDGWRFALVDPGGITDPTGAYAGAAEPGYDDSAWRQIAVPHDWSIELAPTTEHGTTSGTGFFPGGLGWYRNTFTLPPGVAGKRVSVEFDGVYMDSYVYCNGTSSSADTPTATPASPSTSPTCCTPTAPPRTSSPSRSRTSCPAAAGTRAAASTARPASSSPTRCTCRAGARTSPRRTSSKERALVRVDVRAS